VVVTGTPAGDGTVTASSTVAVFVSSQPVSYRQAYLPLVLREEPLTHLFVTSDDTGGISRLEIWRVSGNILMQYCENIPDNTVSGIPAAHFRQARTGLWHIRPGAAHCKHRRREVPEKLPYAYTVTSGQPL